MFGLMRAAVIADDRTLEVAEVDDPAPGPGELVLEVKAVGKPGITHTVDLAGLPEAFEAIKSPTDQCKVLVQP